MKLWKSLKAGTKSGVQWTRIEARVGAGIPDINGAMSCGEFWLELKVCKTKKFKTAGLWRPHQVSWQYSRSTVFRNVWNVISHPEDDRIYFFRCDKIVDLNEPDVLVEPDYVMDHPFDWGSALDFIRASLLESRSAMDECADA